MNTNIQSMFEAFAWAAFYKLTNEVGSCEMAEGTDLQLQLLQMDWDVKQTCLTAFLKEGFECFYGTDLEGSTIIT